ncbi:MAG: hypothetical protein R3D98_03890 [Candidatus Krumholzibacteriia bacterium]
MISTHILKRNGGAAAACLLFVVGLAVPAAAQLPVLTVQEPELGQWTFEGVDAALVAVEVGEGEALDFSWLAVPGDGGAAISGYRYGWDLVDPSDPFDPGWATDLQPDLLAAPTQVFSTGVHTLHVEVRDDADGVTRGGVEITVIPPVPVRSRSWSEVRALVGR